MSHIMDANLPMTIESQTAFPWLSLIVLLPAVGALIMPLLPKQENKQSLAPEISGNAQTSTLYRNLRKKNNGPYPEELVKSAPLFR